MGLGYKGGDATEGGRRYREYVEDMRFGEDGAIMNPNFTDFKIPTALDIPDEIIPILGVESLQHDGPYGARGIGEHTMIPVAPMVANAEADALGIRIKRILISEYRKN